MFSITVPNMTSAEETDMTVILLDAVIMLKSM